ncbi:YopX family protein [Bacillus wiedmannii]|uniref:YopX family protein n=1 Tax=Bacillus wiedmannii TaxID=1890302 RepID=UPI0021D15364|nr:YopX family protein [Bacillus wiedmannii]MCU5706117.1 YopX family protein [Bacillus wiedmannii]
MRESKFRYTFKHIGTGNIEKKIYTLKQLEERNANELSPCFNKEFGYELVSRDQYIGLKDKNENEIYERDVVDATYDGESFVGIVVYDASELGFKATNGKENYGSNFQYLTCCEEVEVIGDIYENTELLKGDEE